MEITFTAWTREQIQEHRQTFLAALRSDEFIQGFDSLTTVVRGVERNCCLGVACELALRDGVVDRQEYGNVFRYSTGYDDWSSGVLHYAVAQWLGTDNEEEDPTLVENLPVPVDEYGSGRYSKFYAAELNDSRAFSFSQIADLFERYFAHLDAS